MVQPVSIDNKAVVLEMKSTSSSVAFFRVVGLIYNLSFYFFPKFTIHLNREVEAGGA